MMSRMHFPAIGAMILVILTASALWAQPTTIELRSGQGDIGTEDPLTEVRIVDPAPASEFFPAAIVPSSTIVTIGTSRAISTDNDPTPGSTVCEAEFRVTFDLPQALQSPSISVRLAADDSGGVFLNGNRLGSDPLGGSAVTVQSSDPTLFLPGENTLTFLIRNGRGTACPFGHLMLAFEASITFEETEEPLTAEVDILSPENNAVVCEDNALVSGVVRLSQDPAGFSIECDVNDVVATVQDTTFEALVPLASRDNRLVATCTITDAAGSQVSAADSIDVFLDDRAPMCKFTSEDGAVEGVYIDRHSGIASVQPIDIKNGVLTVDSFEPGDDKVGFRIDVIDPSKSMSFLIEVTDVCGNVFNCDPVFLNLPADKAVRQFEFTFPAIDRYFEITNAGLSEVRIDLNGQKFKLVTNADRAAREPNTFLMPATGKLKFDMQPLLHPEDNLMFLAYEGPVNSEAEVFISDIGVNMDFVLNLVTIPEAFALLQNYPNPFNPTTSIRFDIPAGLSVQTPVRLGIYNLLGVLVRNLIDEPKSPGQHTVEWNGKDDAGLPVASGIYIYQLRVGEFTATRRMLFLK